MGAQESKLQLRKNVLRISQQKNIPREETSFWAQFLEFPESAEDIFNLFSPKDLRKLRDEASENIHTLLLLSSEELQQAATSNDTLSKEQIKRLLNAIRILTRVLPFLFELDQSFDHIFWQDNTGIGMSLVQNIVKILFLKGFTLPDVVADKPGVYYIIWYPGVGSKNAPPESQVLINHRTEALRLLLVLLSYQMYIPPEKLTTYPNKWQQSFSIHLERKARLALFCSLLNTVITYDPVGWAIPYNHVLFTDTREQLVLTAVECLTVLLDGGTEPLAPHESSPTLSEGHSSDHGAVRSPDLNIQAFRVYLSKIHHKDDFVLLLDNICRLIRNSVESSSSLLPGSARKLEIHVDLLMLLCKLFEYNEKFLSFAVESDRVLVILSCLMHFIMSARQDNRLCGLARLCVYLVHILSQHRAFGVQLNQPFDSTGFPGNVAGKLVPFFSTGTWADFFTLSIYIVVTSTARSPLAPLHEHLMVSYANSAPYIKSLTSIAVNKLLSLLTALSSPAYLLNNEGNHRVLFFLVESINMMLLYQTNGHANLVYSIVRAKDKIQDLAKMTFDSAQQEVARLKASKARKSATAESPDSSRQNSLKPGEEIPTKSSSQDNVEVDPSSLFQLHDEEEPEGRASSNDRAPRKQISEKALGKLPATSNTPSTDLAPIPLYDSKGKFVPTAEWFSFWKSRLSLSILLILLDSVAPIIEQICLEKEVHDDRQVIDHIESGTLVGLLPPPPPIVVRKFLFNDGVRVWFLSYLWGYIYIKHITPTNAETARMCPPVFAGTQVKLFHLKS